MGMLLLSTSYLSAVAETGHAHADESMTIVARGALSK